MSRQRNISVINKTNPVPQMVTRSCKMVQVSKSSHLKDQRELKDTDELCLPHRIIREMVHKKSDFYNKMEAILHDSFTSISRTKFKTYQNLKYISNENKLLKLKTVNEFVQISLNEELASGNCKSAFSKLLAITNDEFIDVNLFRLTMNSMRNLEQNIYVLNIFNWLLMYLQMRPPCNSIIRDYYDSVVNKDNLECEKLMHRFLKFNMHKTLERLIKLTFYIEKKEEYKKIDTFEDWLARDNFLMPKLKDLKAKQKLIRLFLLFDIHTELLYLDLNNFIGGNEVDRKKLINDCPIINKTIWGFAIPSVSEHCKNVFQLLFRVLPEFRINVQRYIFLIGEAMRLMDEKNYSSSSNPYLGNLCKKFAIELSKGINDIKDGAARNEIVEGIQLPWLKILVSYCLFTESITLHQVEINVLANSLNRLTAPKKKPRNNLLSNSSTSNEFYNLPKRIICNPSERTSIEKEKSFLLYTFFISYIELHHVKDVMPQTFLIAPKGKENHSISLVKINEIVQNLNTVSNGIEVQDVNIWRLSLLFNELIK